MGHQGQLDGESWVPACGMASSYCWLMGTNPAPVDGPWWISGWEVIYTNQAFTTVRISCSTTLKKTYIKLKLFKTQVAQQLRIKLMIISFHLAHCPSRSSSKSHGRLGLRQSLCHGDGVSQTNSVTIVDILACGNSQNFKYKNKPRKPQPSHV